MWEKQCKSAVEEGLSAEQAEDKAEQNRKPDHLGRVLHLASANIMMRPGDCEARGEKDQRVQQRQIKRIENLNTLRWPDAANRFLGEQAGIKERPEPCRKEHHL